MGKDVSYGKNPHRRRFAVPGAADFRLSRAQGFCGVSAGDALQTWMKALREKPEAIVLDLNLPGGTGIEVLKRLRMSDKTRHIPAVVVSGSSEPNFECTVKELGAHDFLQKPVDPSQLCEMLSRLLAPPSPDKK